ncbi:MAG TPA: YggS family pyridoxal phosphate-dependent enzyme [Kofleriaceae bacterium]|nr:YggS family pyridoxal phosphate-dependent enzyme [Kofleriaceae bacterium]
MTTEEPADRDLAGRVASVRERMARAAGAAGRDPASIELVAVSKLHPAAAVAAAARAGVVHVGENYAQEMVGKIDALAADPACAGLSWHFIGRLQRNKAKLVVGRAAVIHAVDSIDLAREIARRAATPQAILLAVSAAGEAQKTGADPEALPELLAAVGELPGLDCRGFMTMPPWPDRPEDSRPYFRALRDLRDRLASAARPLPVLSMGTTADLEVAVEEGATLVRVGTAIFGARPAGDG